MRRVRTYGVPLVWAAFFGLLWWYAFFTDEQGVYTHSLSVWGDWAAHVSFANVFHFRPMASWMDQHPVFVDGDFTYPFAVDLFSGLLMRLGLPLVYSFNWPSFFTSTFFVFVIWGFYRHLTRSNLTAGVALSLFLVSGGIGIFFVDAAHPQATHNPSQHLHWLTPILSEFLPQRGMLLGIPYALCLMVAIFERKSHAMVLGLLCSALMFIHMHSYMVLVLVCAVLFFFQPRPLSRWIRLAIGAGIPSIMIYFWIHAGQSHANFFGIAWGWMKEEPKPGMNFFQFWFWNWGLFLPLAILGTVRSRLWKSPWVVSGWLLFGVSNVVRLQPWVWDNAKLLTWSHLFLCLGVASVVARCWERKKLRTVAIFLFLSLTVSGGYDVYRMLAGPSYTMWTSDDFRLAEEFRKISGPTDRVLASDKPHHWVSSLTGRKVFLGYRGWVWAWGHDYSIWERRMKEMFAGVGEGQQALDAYQVKFVVIGPEEMRDFGANEDYFKNRWKLRLESPRYRVYGRK